jgi:thymidylate kinase
MYVFALMRKPFAIFAGRRNTSRRGLWIALYGPDGAGKSAVGDRLAVELADGFSRVQLHHLRIQPGHTSPQSAPVTQPHAQPSRGLALSYLKLLYMLAHAWLTHWLITLPSIEAGHLVIFDRYFLDYAIDPRRYRLHPRTIGFASLLGRLGPRPNLQFVLDVPAQELQRRKSEVSLAESERQRQEYAKRIGSRPNAVITNADRPPTDVATEIMRQVREYSDAESEVVSNPDLLASDLRQ